MPTELSWLNQAPVSAIKVFVDEQTPSSCNVTFVLHLLDAYNNNKPNEIPQVGSGRVGCTQTLLLSFGVEKPFTTDPWLKTNVIERKKQQQNRKINRTNEETGDSENKEKKILRINQLIIERSVTYYPTILILDIQIFLSKVMSSVN